MYIYICMYIYIYIYIYVLMHIYIYMHIFMNVYTCIFTRIHMYVYICTHSVCTYAHTNTLWSKEPPPPGKVSRLLCSLIKNPEEEDPPRSTWYKLFEGGPLPPGSWSGNIENRKPPPGGGVLSINSLSHTHQKTLIHVKRIPQNLRNKPIKQKYLQGHRTLVRPGGKRDLHTRPTKETNATDHEKGISKENYVHGHHTLVWTGGKKRPTHKTNKRDGRKRNAKENYVQDL